jgi:hypothetical protein
LADNPLIDENRENRLGAAVDNVVMIKVALVLWILRLHAAPTDREIGYANRWTLESYLTGVNV